MDTDVNDYPAKWSKLKIKHTNKQVKVILELLRASNLIIVVVEWIALSCLKLKSPFSLETFYKGLELMLTKWKQQLVSRDWRPDMDLPFSPPVAIAYFHAHHMTFFSFVVTQAFPF